MGGGGEEERGGGDEVNLHTQKTHSDICYTESERQ